MENLDTGLEQRVWQRVREDTPQLSLQALAAGEWNTAAICLRLAGMTQGPQKALLRQLYQRERRHGRCLAGMHMTAAGKALSVRTAAPAADPIQTALRKCYTQALRNLKEYERRSSDADFGPVFSCMARQEQENCAILLELMASGLR